MGRQAYQTRLAFGRSAFEAPLRDEHGNVIIGIYSGATDDTSYRQQWNERGHPENVASEQRAKKFRRAQNEILQVCGFVVQKDAEKRKEVIPTPWSHKYNIVKRENTIGFMLKAFDRLGGVLVSWWASILRQRILTFGCRSSSVVQMLYVDINEHSLRAILLSGFSSFLCSIAFKAVRYYARDPEAEEIVNYTDPGFPKSHSTWTDRLSEILSNLGFFSLEFSIEIISILQRLYFLDLQTFANRRTGQILANGLSNLIQNVFTDLSVGLQQSTSTSILFSPFILAITRDFFTLHIGFRTYSLLLQVSIKANRPDAVSIAAADDDEFIDDSSVQGIGRRIGGYTTRRYHGPSSFWPAFRIAFPFFRKPTVRILAVDSYVGERVIRNCARSLGEIEATMSTQQQLHSQTNAMLENLASMMIDIEEDVFVDLDTWSGRLTERRLTASDDSSTEDEDDEPILDGSPDQSRPTETLARLSTEVEMSAIQTLSTSAANGSDEATTSQPSDAGGTAQAVRLETLLQAMDEPSAPPTPEPGIVRAGSLALTEQGPVRRFTEVHQTDIDQALARFRQHDTSIKEEAWQPLHKRESRHFKVSRLSVFASDSFAWHASALITNLVMLPFEAIFLRTVAGWFYTNSSNNIDLLRAPLGVTTWLGGDTSTMGKARYVGALILCLGLESVSRGIVWGIGSQVAIAYNKAYS